MTASVPGTATVIYERCGPAAWRTTQEGPAAFAAKRSPVWKGR